MKKQTILLLLNTLIFLCVAPSAFAQQKVLFYTAQDELGLDSYEYQLRDTIEAMPEFTIARVVDALTFSQMNHPDSFAAYDIVVICESGGSTYSVNYGIGGAGFPLPTLCLEPYAPGKPEWFGTNRLSVPKDQVDSSMATFMIIKNDSHPIINNLDVSNGDIIDWTLGWNTIGGAGEAHVSAPSIDSAADANIANNVTLLASNLQIEYQIAPNACFLASIDSNATCNRMVVWGIHSLFLEFATQPYFDICKNSMLWLANLPIQSSNAYLENIIINGASLPGFIRNTVVYYYGVGTCHDSSDIHDVVAIAENSGATIYIDTADHAFDTTLIKVTSSDGTTQKTYTIVFYPLSNSVATLNKLYIDGDSIFGFNPDQFIFEYTYPYGTSSSHSPTIYTEPSAECITYEIDNATSLSDTTFIKVYSSDSSVINQYVISYIISGPNNIATLSSINIGGHLLDGFSPTVFNYIYYVPIGTSTLPPVTYTLTDYYASAILDNASAVYDTAFITVTAQDGITKNIYSIIFIPSAFASYNVLFYSDQYLYDSSSYEYRLKDSLDAMPQINITKIVNASEFSSMIDRDTFAAYDAVVICESGGSAYCVNYGSGGAGFPLPTLCLEPYAPGKPEWFNTSLIRIEKLDVNPDSSGRMLVKDPNHRIFNNMDVTYNDTLQWTLGWNTIGGEGEAHVSAPGVESAADPNIANNVTLLASNLQIEQQIAPNACFLSAIDSNSTCQRMVIWGIHALFLEKATQVYYDICKNAMLWLLNASEAPFPQPNAYLSDLRVAGTTINGFLPEKFNYSYTIPYGSVTIPEVTCTTQDSTAHYSIEDAVSAGDTTFITVNSYDSSLTNVYAIIFNEGLPVSIATLDDILVNSISIPGFETDSLGCYVVDLSAGTTEIPTITCTLTDSHSSYEIIPGDSINDPAYIIVTAEDDVTSLTYCVRFNILVNVKHLISDVARIFPTYVKDVLNIELKNDALFEGTIVITSLTGKEWINQKVESNIITIDCSKLPAGMLFVTIIKENKKFVGKIIK